VNHTPFRLTIASFAGLFALCAVLPAALQAGQQLAATDVEARTPYMIEVPVLNRLLMPGDVVAPDALEWLSMRVGRIGANVVLDPARIIGLAAQRTLRPGEPLRERDVKPRVVVAKGTLVTMLVRTDSMMLSAQGRALEDGAMGQAIRAINTQTNRTVEAEVLGPGVVVARLAQAIPIARGPFK
jgi:flagellar basal body P-ring formation protein FlgA